MSVWKSLSEALAATLVAGVVAAVVLSPVAAIAGVAVNRTESTMQTNIEDITTGTTPGVTTILDNADKPIAWLYKQRRYPVPSERIAKPMKDAIVSIEDRRFYEHKGVDIQGNLRAMATNLLAGGVEQGASTLDQQYVKNYLLFVTSENADEQAAATETSVARKLREMRMASTIDERLSKDEILSRYLNLVPFGNNTFGVEAASQTYFQRPAAELTVPQAAMLAGMVQSSSYFDPYTNAEAVTERRNAVLDAMVSSNTLSPADAAAFKAEPLGVVEQPQGLPNGCIAAGDAGFFCDYVLKYLEGKGLGPDKLTQGSYTIRTTLDRNVLAAARSAAAQQVDPHAAGVAEVLNVIEPGANSRKILAMTSSREYGLDLEAGQTVLPQTSSLVGNGAGSVFKIFTAAAALDAGFGLNTPLQVPATYQAEGMGEGGAPGCPAGSYCVANDGTYPPTLTLQNALAESPNTTFVKLIEQVGVKPVVDISVKLGLRSYADPGSFDGSASIADYVKDHNLGSYTLGPHPVNALELSNVGASIASDGRWCEPDPLRSVTDADGNEVMLDKPKCEQAIDKEVAHALGAALSKDVISGTGSDAAKAARWKSPLAAKTGTTESHQSAAFLGFNSKFAAATYVYNDGTSVAPVCTSPARQCAEGSMYGGNEPARTWFAAAQGSGIATAGTLPPFDNAYTLGKSNALANKYVGKDIAVAQKELTGQGYRVLTQIVPGNGAPKNQVMRGEAPTPLKKGDTITLYLSDGTVPTRTRPTPTPSPQPLPTITPNDLDQLGETLRGLLGR